ncbi:MAG: helix-turn-helix domain-containing protein [Burkholderiaceae bacterium]
MGRATEAMTGHVCPDGRHDETAAAAYLGLKPTTLRAWRARGTGPAYYRAGKVWYRVVDLVAWIESRRVEPAAADA